MLASSDSSLEFFRVHAAEGALSVTATLASGDLLTAPGKTESLSQIQIDESQRKPYGRSLSGIRSRRTRISEEKS